MLLINYYMPRLKKQLIFYPVIAVILYLLVFFTLRWDGGVLTGVLTGNILSMMLIYGALIFASRNGIEIDTALPVDWRHKAAFAVVYTFVVVPLLVAIPMQLCYLCTWQWAELSPLIREVLPVFKTLSTGRYMWMTVATTAFSMSVCLYCVMAIKHNRVILAIVWTIVANISESVLGGVVGAVSSFKQGFEDGVNGVEHTPNEITESILSQVGSWTPALTVFFAICTIFAIVMTCRVIKNRQI
ncbi:MAG: hypothetical protein K2L31_06730 [Muribaculum sp.]|nr:hypothetical protein [Muribaculum sp.]MDE6458275.1 hypothetical protein [Muribaculum sp.]